MRWQPTGADEGVIEAIEPRDTLIRRGDFRGRPRPLAANVDLMILVLAEPPGIDAMLVDRYLILARDIGLDIALWLNKSDALPNPRLEAILAQLERYQALVTAIGAGSSRTAGGTAELAAWMAGRTAILVGQSGVGKSSLANALLPDIALRTGALSRASGQGQHTTSTTAGYPLPGGGTLIDSPGVRTLRLDHLSADAVRAGFPDIDALTGQCRFRDCRHRKDAGCAVTAAVSEGRLHPDRIASFHRLMAEATPAPDRN